jgi:5-methylcytosine-specific restriction protein A
MTIKPENRKFYGREWRRIRRKILQERGYKCEKCGRTAKDTNLTIHHKDRNPKNNSNDNLIVVCPRCHFQEERKINYYNNPTILQQ